MMSTGALAVPLPQHLTDSDWYAPSTTATMSQQAMLSDDREWKDAIESALSSLLRLPPDWDSYGAACIGHDCASTALELLSETMRDDSPAPSVVPTSQGGVQLEWHRDQMDLEVEILSPSRIHGFFEDHRTGESWEGDISYNLERMTEAIARLSAAG